MEYRDTLQHLVEIDTSGPDAAGCRAAIALLQAEFDAAGLATSLVDIPPESVNGLHGRAALLARRGRPGQPRLIIYGHVDVVPAEGWDAFSLKAREGRLYGRGTADMKGALVALVGALNALRDHPLAYDVSVLVTMDEETHQLEQLEYLTDTLDPGPRPLVVTLDTGFGYVSIANLGVLQMDIHVKGESVHSGLSHMGANAVEGAAKLINRLFQLRDSLLKHTSSVRAHPDTRLEFLQPRLNINQVSGGVARNVVPDSCTFSIDRRLIPEETLDEARAGIMEALRSVDGVQWDVAREFVIPPVPPCTDPAASDLADIVQAVCGEAGLYGEMMSGELPYAATKWWNGVVFGTGLIRPDSRVHGTNEHIHERDLERLVMVLSRFLAADREEAA